MKIFFYSTLITILMILLAPSAAMQTTIRLGPISQCALDVNGRLPPGEMVGAMPFRSDNSIIVPITDYDGNYLRQEDCKS